tara:strand:- start:2640 stop:3746 length:1107 start_codon:yes stop_codon:yes gene_type:complete
MKKIIIFVNDYNYFISHKYDALKELDNKKYLFEIFSPHKINYKKSNFYFKPYFIDPLSKNLLKEFYTFFQMFFIILKNKDKIFHYFTIKPILYGSIISKILCINKNLFIFSGLGNILLNPVNSFYKNFIIFLLKISLNSKKHKFIFQNKNDYKFLKINKIIESKNIFFTIGSGLNFKKMPKLKKINKNSLNIIMPCRMKYHKGIMDLIEIAKYFKKSNKNINFFLAGNTKNSNDYINYNYLNSLSKKKDNIKWLKEIKSKKYLYENYDIILILSFYGEGIPRVILESTYYGKTLISYNIPGCKDVIKKNINGYLIKLRDKKSVCITIEMLYKNRLLLNKNSKTARLFAFKNFGIDKVKKVYEKIYLQI